RNEDSNVKKLLSFSAKPKFFAASLSNCPGPNFTLFLRSWVNFYPTSGNIVWFFIGKGQKSPWHPRRVLLGSHRRRCWNVQSRRLHTISLLISSRENLWIVRKDNLHIKR